MKIRARLQIVIVSLSLAGLAACSKDGSSERSEVKRDLAPAHRQLAQAFADRVMAKDYRGAYAYVAKASQGEIPYAEFEEAFKGYREGMPESMKLAIDPGEPFKKEEAENLPDAIRDRVEDEFTLHFEAGPEQDGFSANLWVLKEEGQPKVAYFYVGD